MSARPHRTGAHPAERQPGQPPVRRTTASRGVELSSTDRRGDPATEEQDLAVRVELVVVDGPAAAAWRAQQAAAIRALLDWAATDPPAPQAPADAPVGGGAERTTA